MKLKDILLQESGGTLFFKFDNSNKMDAFRTEIEGDEEVDPKNVFDVLRSKGSDSCSILVDDITDKLNKTKEEVITIARQFGGTLEK